MTLSALDHGGGERCCQASVHVLAAGNMPFITTVFKRAGHRNLPDRQKCAYLVFRGRPTGGRCLAYRSASARTTIHTRSLNFCPASLPSRNNLVMWLTEHPIRTAAAAGVINGAESSPVFVMPDMCIAESYS